MEKDNNKLNKKIVTERPVKKEEYKGNTFVGFLVVLFIIALIFGAFYYLETHNITDLVKFF